MFAVIRLGGVSVGVGETEEEALYMAERNLDLEDGALDAVERDTPEYREGTLILIDDENPLWAVYEC